MASLSRQTLVLLVAGLGLFGWALAASENRNTPPTSAVAKAPGVEGYRVTGPFTHENLAIFLLHGQDTLPPRQILTLDEALSQKSFVVHETGEVNTLVVENLSEADDVLIQNGDIVKGGRQDRLIASAVLVPARSGSIAVPSFCVEQGRWSGRQGEVATSFAENDSVIATKGLKNAANVAGDQGEVWKSVEKLQQSLSANVGKDVTNPQSRTSLQLALEDKVLKDRLRGYEDRLGSVLRGTNGVVGFVIAVNGKVTGAEVFGSSAVMAKAWPKALRSAAVEAVAEKAGAPFEAPSCGAAMAFLVDAERGQKEEMASASRFDLSNRDVRLESGQAAVAFDFIPPPNPNSAPNADAIHLDIDRPLVSLRRGDANPAPELNGVALPLPASNLGGNERHVLAGLSAEPAAAPVRPAQPVRLAPVSVSRVQGQNGVLVESRSKQNPSVVIHRSFIAK